MSSVRGVNVGGFLFDVTDSSNVAPIQLTNFASRPYAKDRCFIMADGLLYRATVKIESGDPIVINGNCRRTTLDEIISVIETDSDLIAPTEDGATSSDGYEVGDEIVRSGILYNVISAISEGDAFVIGNNIDIAGSLTSQIKTLVNNDDAMFNVLGAKNLLPNTAITQTISGVTFTVNSDGSVHISGTNNTSDPITFFVSGINGISLIDYVVAEKFDLAVSMGAVHDEDVVGVLWGCRDSTTDTVSNVFASGGDLVIQSLGHTIHINGVALRVLAGKTVDKTYYPMIRPASAVDDTYAPYAMTNRELSYSSYANVSSGAGASISVNLVRIGHIAMINIANGAFTANALETLFTVPSEFRPSLAVDFRDSYSGKRVELLTDGRFVTTETISNAPIRGSFTYITAN